MCGIFAYIGSKDASKVILEGLKRLEYRGYDSWGIAVAGDEIKLSKKVGAIGDLNYLDHLPKSGVGIGHTRWATHGGITDENAHPHFSSDKSFCLAQNGIVENFQELKLNLENKGYKFTTDTDTEAIVKLVEHYLESRQDIREAIRLAFLDLQGRNTIIVLTKSGEIIAARNGSPLVLGLNEATKEIFFSSDTLSFAPLVKKIVIIENGQLASFINGKVELLDGKSGKHINFKAENLNLKSSKVDKEGYEHFMLKEIHETPYVINQLLNQNLKQYIEFAKEIKKAKNVYTIGSGTAGVAASQIAFYLRIFAKINAVSLIGADSLDYLDLIEKGDLSLSPSQSGETADVLEVLEKLKVKGVKIASLVNMLGSSMSRLSDFKFYSNAGPEICVMSTKVFTSQIAWGYLISKIISNQLKEGINNLKLLRKEIENYLNLAKNHELIKQIAKILSTKKDIFLIGKYQNLNIIKEGMIKIIEGSYKHAHGISSGDLKHYAITLIEKGVPTVAVISNDKARSSVLNAVSEVKARGAFVIGISPQSSDSFDLHIPVPDTGETSAIFNIIPLQLLAYYLALELGNNIDKPRNIAKSVTVR